ncbi:MAG TPA: CdaR family protein [Candidatus Dormibacteraeota bacterium]|nr:CdaR family protein [Candidatus Dormibacteraeota bacterium]
MNLILDDWRLKLLAIGLAILMLGAVAFSQNPPTNGSLTVRLNYTMPPNLILINPPVSAVVTYSGLADVIKKVNPDNLTAFVDVTHAKPGPAVTLNITPHSTIQGLSVQNPAPIVADVETLQPKDLPVQVTARPAPGWSVNKAVAICAGASQPNPCVVRFTGPASWENSLVATVVFAAQVNVGSIDSPSQPVVLQNSNGTLDQSIRTVPSVSLDFPNVSVHIEATPGSTSSTVALVDAPPSNPPPPGYRVTGITISPQTVIITGEAAVLARIQSILLPPVDLSAHTADATFQVAIPYKAGMTGNVANATVKYSISANPNVSPSP